MKSWDRDFEKISSPVLSIYADWGSHILQLYSNYDDETLSDIERFVKYYNSWQRKNINRFKAEIENSIIVELPNTSHHCFIHKQDEVVKSIG